MVHRIVLGTDGSATAAKAVAEARDLAKAEGARVHVVTAFKGVLGVEPITSSSAQDRVDMHKAADNVAARAAEQLTAAGVEVDFEAREGDPADVLIEVATEDDADLIVVGNKGMTGIGRFLLGSVPNKVTHHAPCSVMVVRTD
jgi:nucleotide-binding universal stress UspA family protein